MNKNIIIVSSSRADKYLLEPISERLGDKCEFYEMLQPVTHHSCLNAFTKEDKGRKVVLLGDRWETCLLAFSAIQNDMLIYHLHGGEVTAGSKDEMYRNSITKMAHVHMAAHQNFASRIKRMGEAPKNIFSPGSLGVWRAKQIKIPEKENLLAVILHPNTIEPHKTEEECIALIDALMSFRNHRIKFYAPGNDEGGGIIKRKIKAFCELYGQEYIEEEPGDVFLHSLAASKCIIGNSSCGIIESPSLKTPTINLGSRQDGRPKAMSITECDFNAKNIKEHIELTLQNNWPDHSFANPYDNTENDTVEMICDIIKNHPVKFQKRFVD